MNGSVAGFGECWGNGVGRGLYCPWTKTEELIGWHCYETAISDIEGQ